MLLTAGLSVHRAVQACSVSMTSIQVQHVCVGYEFWQHRQGQVLQDRPLRMSLTDKTPLIHYMDGQQMLLLEAMEWCMPKTAIY